MSLVGAASSRMKRKRLVGTRLTKMSADKQTDVVSSSAAYDR